MMRKTETYFNSLVVVVIYLSVIDLVFPIDYLQLFLKILKGSEKWLCDFPSLLTNDSDQVPESDRSILLQRIFLGLLNFPYKP